MTQPVTVTSTWSTDAQPTTLEKPMIDPRHQRLIEELLTDPDTRSTWERPRTDRGRARLLHRLREPSQHVEAAAAFIHALRHWDDLGALGQELLGHALTSSARLAPDEVSAIDAAQHLAADELVCAVLSTLRQFPAGNIADTPLPAALADWLGSPSAALGPAVASVGPGGRAGQGIVGHLLTSAHPDARLAAIRAASHGYLEVSRGELDDLARARNGHQAFALLLADRLRRRLRAEQVGPLVHGLTRLEARAVARRVLPTAEMLRWPNEAVLRMLQSCAPRQLGAWVCGQYPLQPSVRLAHAVGTHLANVSAAGGPDGVEAVLSRTVDTIDASALDRTAVRDLLEAAPLTVSAHVARVSQQQAPTKATPASGGAGRDALTDYLLRRYRERLRSVPDLRELADMAAATQPATITDLLDVAASLRACVPTG